MRFQINQIKNDQWIEVEVFDNDDKSVFTNKLEITPELDFNEVKQRIKTLIKRKNNLDDFRSKLGKKFDPNQP